MEIAMTTQQRPAPGATRAHHDAKASFLDTYRREYETTVRVLRAYPEDKLDLRPHTLCKSARELAYVFVAELGFATMAFNDAFASGAMPSGGGQPAPTTMPAILTELDRATRDYLGMIERTPDEKLRQTVKFFVGPKTLGDVSRIDLIWMMLHDLIHHRGQFSIYLRMAGGKVPSIYGPTADEPWM